MQIAATCAAWLLRAREDAFKRQLPYIVALAVGVLLATALLHLMPEAVASLGNTRLVWSLAGAAMVFLFATERIFFVFTGADAEPELATPCEQSHHHHGSHSTRPSNLILASMMHSFVDGAAVAVAFLASPRIGWLTAGAVALHEIPHRMGDFALLVHLKVPLNRALKLAALAGLPSFLGLALVLLAGVHTSGIGGSTASGLSTASNTLVGWLLPLSAGSFLYIATVNLLPELRAERRLSRALLQIACLCAGIAVVVAAGAD